MHFISPVALEQQFPLTPSAKNSVEKNRKIIKKIIDRQDPRLLLVVGPCSIHNVEEGIEFAKQLKEIPSDQFFPVMRAYIEKPRTKAGWKGLVHDPHLNGSDDVDLGLTKSRMFLCALAEMGIPTATEFLTPQLTPYIEDLISWGCIGARTSSSQIHRVLASHLSMPVGFKNSVDGNVECAINAIHASKMPHTFLHTSKEGRICKIKSKGNPYTHVVLRGSLQRGNFDRESVQEVISMLRQHELPPRILIDCSHGNSRGHYFKQKEVFLNVMEQVQKGNRHIIGMMLESNLEPGSQLIPPQLTELQSGVSVTDACLDLSTTIELTKSVSLSSTVMSLTQS